MGFTNNRYIVKSPYEYGTLASSAVGNCPFVRICSTVSNTTVTLRNAAGDTIGSVLMGNAGDSIVIEKDVNETLSTNLPVYATGEGAGVLPPPMFIVTPANIDPEQGTGSFTVLHMGEPGTYYWTINNITTSNADFAAVSGSFTTTTVHGTGTFNITTVADLSTEGTQTFTVSVRSGSTSGTILVTSGSVTVNDTSLTPAAIGDVAGLYRTTYTGYFADDPTFFATATVNATAVNLSPIRDGDPGFEPFSTQHLGYFKPATTETYTFYLTSDDASFMWLGANAVSGFNTGNALINNGGVHGSNEVSASIALTAGVYYPIRIQYGDQSGGDVLELEFSTPTITKDENVTGLIFYNSTTNGH